VRVTVDTNILVRATVGDDPEQERIAAELLRTAELIAVPLVVLCEFVWVTRHAYRRGHMEIGEAIRELVASPVVRVDRPAVEAGLAMLAAGGDFADGVIAFEGRRLGGEVFASFDRAAIQLVTDAGSETLLVGSPGS